MRFLYHIEERDSVWNTGGVDQIDVRFHIHHPLPPLLCKVHFALHRVRFAHRNSTMVFVIPTYIERTSGLKSVDEEKIRSGTCKPFVYSTIPFTNKVALADKVPVFSYVDGRCPIIKSLPNRLLNDDHRTDQVD